jgi:hypothetical protein
MISKATAAGKQNVKYYLSRYWISLTTSFFLFCPYFSRYADEKNRLFFHWTNKDLIALLCCIILVSLVNYVLFVILHFFAGDRLRKTFNTLFVAVFSLAVVSNLIHVLPLPSTGTHFISQLPENYKYILLLPWLLLMGYTIIKGSQTIKAVCMSLCFFISPFLPIFVVTTLTYSQWESGIGNLQSFLQEPDNNNNNKPNIYIFIFDEWSYQRSFKNQKPINFFADLKTFNEQSLTFHQAYSPAAYTLVSIPSFLFQTFWPFDIKQGKMGFRVWKKRDSDNNFIETFEDLDNYKTIFQYPRKLGYATCIIGKYIPYGTVLGKRVDFSYSSNDKKYFGQGFPERVLSHFFSAVQLIPKPLSSLNKIFCYVNYRNNFNILNLTNNLFTKIVEKKKSPVFGIFHYELPHGPFIYTHEGHKPLYCCYDDDSPENYYGNLAFLNTKIAEIITTLKNNNKFQNSLIVMMSDHSWRADPENDKNNESLDWRHIPFFIKFPHQKNQIDIKTEFLSSNLGNVINSYLDGKFDYSQAQLVLDSPNFKVRRSEDF